jgi:hypothetical protein
LRKSLQHCAIAASATSLDPVRLPFTSAMIDPFERLALLFGNADLPIGSDMGMTAPTSAKAEWLQVYKTPARDCWWFAPQIGKALRK